MISNWISSDSMEKRQLQHTQRRSSRQCLQTRQASPSISRRFRTRERRIADLIYRWIYSASRYSPSSARPRFFNNIELFRKNQETWLRAFLELLGGILSNDTFNRVFSMVSPEEFLRGCDAQPQEPQRGERLCPKAQTTGGSDYSLYGDQFAEKRTILESKPPRQTFESFMERELYSPTSLFSLMRFPWKNTQR